MTLAGDACGGEKTQRDIWGTHTRENLRGEAVDKTPYCDEAGRVSDCFLPFCENYFEKIIFCHNFSFLGKEITINCHNCLHTQKEFFYFSEISPNFVRLVNWQSSTRELSQIWLQVREESRFFFQTPHYTSNIQELNMILIWQTQFLFPPKYGDFGRSFPKKSFEQVTTHFVFGHQVAKIHHKNNPGHYI